MATGLRKVREEHRAQVLGRLRALGPLSRTALARDLRLSVQSVSEIMAELQADGHVAPIGEGTSSGGRRPLLYEVRRDSLRAVGVHVGSGQVAAVISDLSGTVYREVTADCVLADGPAPFVMILERVLDELLLERDPTPLAGIGLALQTTLHRSEAGVVQMAGESGWEYGIDLPAVLERFRLPVVAENRAHAVAVGEHLFGSAQDVNDLLCLMLDHGVGGAVIADGRLFAGGDGGAGALGRMMLDAPGIGSDPVRVTDIAGTSAIRRTARDRLRRAGRHDLGGVEVAQVEIDHVIDRASAGDSLMIAVLADAGRCLGAATAASLCVTDSQLVLLCGSLTRAGDLVIEPLKKEMQRRWPFAPPEVRLGQLGTSAAQLGAAALVLTDKVGTVHTFPTR